MQGVKVYILVEDEEKESEVRIDGNLETLRDLLRALRVEFTPITTLPIEDPKREQREPHAIAA